MTAKTFAVNSSNDLYIDANGNLAIAFDLQATLQACEQAVKTKLGEIVLQTDIGVPYFEVVFNGAPNISIFNAAIKVAILGVVGVLQILSLKTQQERDVLTYTASIETIYGTGVING